MMKKGQPYVGNVVLWAREKEKDRQWFGADMKSHKAPKEIREKH